MYRFVGKAFFGLVTIATLAFPSYAEVVVSDEGVEITREELKAALASTPKLRRSLAANDVGERFELLNNMLQVRKLAAKADSLSSDTPGYWEAQFKIMAVKRQFAYQLEMGEMVVPNPQQLAREYYETQKDKYATKPELRASSHILLPSPPGLPREELREKAQTILDELRAGANFESMVEKHSGDPGSKQRGGSLDAWMRFGDPGFTPPYSEALFTIEEIGGYAEITDSQFGVHIIRLDGIQEGGYYSFDEVKQTIFNDIIAEYRGLAAKEISARYNITDDAFIDGDAMEELFAPYKSE